MASRHDLARALTTGTLSEPTVGDVSFWDLARRERMLPLLVHRLAGTTPIPQAVRREAADDEARAALADRDLGDLLEAFARRDIRALVIKGAALARLHYPRPGLRPRLDADVLIARPDVDRVHALFAATGARLVPHVTGEYVMSQFHYVRTDRTGCNHPYDVHWRVVNPAPFAAAFDFEALWSRAIPLVALGPSARTASTADALLMACVHRAAHHGTGGPLIWLLDVHLLADALSAKDRAAFVVAARAGGVTAVAAHALLESAAVFAGRAAGALAGEVRAAAPAATEPTAHYLQARSRLRETVTDLAGLSWRARGRLVRELIFPPAPYMRTVYGARHRGPLPLLYVRRMMTGLWRWGRGGRERGAPR